jgi:competence protein ComEC
VILTNLVAIPLIAWGALPAGLAGLALTPLSTLLSKWGLLTCAKLVIFATDIVNCISQWPMLSVIPLYLTASRLILLLGILLFLLPLGKNEKRWPRRTLVVLTTIVAAMLTQADVAEFQVTALSVGQGDATLVSLADDAHYLIDGGGLPNSSIDPGERLVAPALGRMGIDHLDGVILTHNHPDHSSGLVHILNRFPVEAFYHAGESSDIPPDLLSVLRQRNIALYRLNDGWTHLLNKGDQSFSLFAPVQTEHDENENSVAVFAGWRDDGVLLTADLGEKGLQQLIEAGLPGRATLLKLPHHGSRLARPQSYLDWTQPTVAFVSAGVGNPYNFPHEQTIKACDAREVPLFRTDLQGMLIFRLVDGQWHAKTEKAL